MQIYLSGGGSEEQTKLIDDTFFSYLKTQGIKTLVYIPLATKREKIQGSIEWFKSAYGNKNVEIVVWNDLEGKDLEDMSNRVAIYIGGGNTYLLMSIIKGSGLASSLIKFIEQDGIIYGGSAGAIILGKDIGIAPEENIVNLEDLNGFNLIQNLSIWPHYNTSNDEKIRQYINDTNINVIAIPEDGGVYMDGNELKSIGVGKVFKFTPTKTQLN